MMGGEARVNFKLSFGFCWTHLGRGWYLGNQLWDDSLKWTCLPSKKCVCVHSCVEVCNDRCRVEFSHRLEKMVSWVFLRCEDHSARRGAPVLLQRKCASRLCSRMLCRFIYDTLIHHSVLWESLEIYMLLKSWRKLHVPRWMLCHLCVCACIYCQL